MLIKNLGLGEIYLEGKRDRTVRDEGIQDGGEAFGWRDGWIWSVFSGSGDGVDSGELPARRGCRGEAGTTEVRPEKRGGAAAETSGGRRGPVDEAAADGAFRRGRREGVPARALTPARKKCGGPTSGRSSGAPERRRRSVGGAATSGAGNPGCHSPRI